MKSFIIGVIVGMAIILIGVADNSQYGNPLEHWSKRKQ